jgi:hypothetical protein
MNYRGYLLPTNKWYDDYKERGGKEGIRIHFKAYSQYKRED